MNKIPSDPWIHIGECPVCVDGLCRVRTCQPEGGEPHFFALCDECESIWTEPDTASQKQFPEPENANCPVCSLPLYGPQSHWAVPDEIRGTAWESEAIFELPTDYSTAEVFDKFVKREKSASDEAIEELPGTSSAGEDACDPSSDQSEPRQGG